MAQASLLEMAREVQLYSGGVAPSLLCQKWIIDRYRKVCENNIWSFKLGRGTFGTPNAYAVGTITMTLASNIVLGVGTTFTSAMVGQQLKVNGVVFTITAFTDATHLTIDQEWLSATQPGLSYIICQAYITPSQTDFHAWYSVVDPFSSWKLHLGFNSRELDRIDARRSATGVPYILANGVYVSTTLAPATSSNEVFELWPSPLAQKQYMYTYERRMPDLGFADVPPGIIRSDTLVKGALADLCRWPGSAERKNPMYDANFMQWRVREQEFNTELEKAMVEDNSIMMNDLSFGRDFRYAPIDANFIQSHAFPSF